MEAQRPLDLSEKLFTNPSEQVTTPDCKLRSLQNKYLLKSRVFPNLAISFLFRYADDSFTSAFVSTVGIDFKVKTVFRQDKRVKLQIWVSESHSNLINKASVLMWSKDCP